MSRFLERPGEIAMRPPLAHLRTHLRCFWMRADRGRLEALCDLAFGGPTRGAVPIEPLGDGVALVWAEIPEIRSTHPLDADRGSASEVDVSLWIPVRLGSRTLWYIPWLFVDSDWALVLGREMYGFPKALGRFEAPPPGQVGTFRVEAMALEDFGPDARARPTTVLEVRPAAGKRRSRVRDAANLLSFSGLLDPAQWLAHTRTWRQGERPRSDLVFLRQLRDVADADEAAFQEVVEAPCEVLAVHSGGLVGDAYEVWLPRCASLPIADTLGLRLDGHPVEAAFQVTFDFVVGAGRTLWRSGPSAPAERPTGADLASIDAFEGFTDAELAAVAHQMRVVRVGDGHVLVREGDPSGHDGLFVLLEGEVALAREEPGRRFARTLRRGEAFGLVALVDRGERTATCTASGPCVLATLDRAAFEALRRGPNRELARKLQWAVARQLARDVQGLGAHLRQLLGGRG